MQTGRTTLDNYSGLGLSAEATSDQASAAYRLLSMRAHPLHQDNDRDQANARKDFEAIARAYEAICAQGNYDASLDSAEIDEMFLEAMYALAQEEEIERTPVRTMVDSLVRQGCPRSIAEQVVDDLASENDDFEPDPDRDVSVVLPKGLSIRQIPWARASVYYAAALRDEDYHEHISDDKYARLLKIRSRWSFFWLGLGVLWLLFVMIGSVGGRASADMLPVTAGLLVVLYLLWMVTRNRFMGLEKPKFIREYRRRYYMRWFARMHECSHSTAPGEPPPGLPLYAGFNRAAFWAGPLWLGYRCMPHAAWKAALAYAGVALVLQFVVDGRWADQLWLAWLLMSVFIGCNANRWYFSALQRQLTPILQSNTSSQAVSKLAETSTVSIVGWIPPLLIMVLGGWCAIVAHDAHQAGLAGWDGWVQTAKSQLVTPDKPVVDAVKPP